MKKAKSPAPAAAPAPTGTWDVEALTNFALKVKSEGFVPADTLKTEFGPMLFTRGIALLYRDFRMFREVRRPWENDSDVLGYEWADRRWSRQEIRKVPGELVPLVQLTTAPLAVKYSDFQTVTAKCIYETPALGAQPQKDADGSATNCFERDRHGNLLIQRYNLRAMITPALAMIGKEQALARRIGFETIRITPNGNLSRVQRPVNDHGQGKGFCNSEKLADGTAFVIKAMVPTSIISIAEYLQALRLAGKTVGLSPGRSAGFGDFEVLEAS